MPNSKRGNNEPLRPPLSLTPRELYLHEKARHATRKRPDARDLLAEAKREYDAQIAAAAAAGKGGRPRKTATTAKKHAG
jgi:hypothetical protein